MEIKMISSFGTTHGKFVLGKTLIRSRDGEVVIQCDSDGVGWKVGSIRLSYAEAQGLVDSICSHPVYQETKDA